MEGGQRQSQEKFFLGGRMGGRGTVDKKRRKNFVLGSPSILLNFRSWVKKNVKNELSNSSKNLKIHKSKPQMLYRVDMVSHPVMGKKKDFPNSLPQCFTKFSLYLFVLFAIFGKAHTFCQSIKRE